MDMRAKQHNMTSPEVDSSSGTSREFPSLLGIRNHLAKIIISSYAASFLFRGAREFKWPLIGPDKPAANRLELNVLSGGAREKSISFML